MFRRAGKDIRESKDDSNWRIDMGVIRAICISEKKGIQKREIPEATLIADYGIEGDAHAGKWHRQVSLLGYEQIEAFRERSKMAGTEMTDSIGNGAFGENMIVEGYDLRSLPVGTKFQIGNVLLELTQIGKECHSHCAIYHAVGDCIMPREGVFTRVLRGGKIRAGDKVTMIPAEPDKPFTAAWITLSDKGFSGEREDKSGPIIDRILCESGYEVVENLLLPDDSLLLQKELIRLADQRQVNLVLTTGGTGFSTRDHTPEATIAVCDRMAPGIAEVIRTYSMTITSRAMLSRGVSGIRKRTLIVNLPGSPKAVEESLEYILPKLEHGLDILCRNVGECAKIK